MNVGGIDLLASIVDIPAESMRKDRSILARGLLALGREARALIQGYASDDPEVRDAAKRRWAELAAKLPVERAEPRAAGLSTGDRERLHAGLRKLVTTLEEITGRCT